MLQFCLLLLLSIFGLSSSSVRTFHNNKVLRLTVSELEDLEFLAYQYENNRSLDFWTEPFRLGEVDVHVEADFYESFQSELNKRGISYYIWIDNVQELVDRQMRPGNPNDFFDEYHSYNEIIEWIRDLPNQYPELVTVFSLGTSYQGRELLALKITRGNQEKPGLFFNGGIHAREWISPATVTWMVAKLLDDYGKDEAVTNLINRLEFIVLPIFNADGYAYTFSNDRLWRKTRRPNTGSSCVGTDPNRNWDFQWTGPGSSTNPCAETYRGPTPFSEIETRTVGNYLKNNPSIRGYIDFHSYSQLWMSPWGYTTNLPPDYNRQNTISALCVEALNAVYGTVYEYGPIATTIYVSSGSSVDYAYGEADILYSFAPELRDRGSYGFLLPPEQIIPSGEETYEALKVWATAVLGLI